MPVSQQKAGKLGRLYLLEDLLEFIDHQTIEHKIPAKAFSRTTKKDVIKTDKIFRPSSNP